LVTNIILLNRGPTKFLGDKYPVKKHDQQKGKLDLVRALNGKLKTPPNKKTSLWSL